MKRHKPWSIYRCLPIVLLPAFLAGLSCTSTDLGAQESPPPDSWCPVTFTLDEEAAAGSPPFSLISGDSALKAIRVLHPRNIGFFAVRAIEVSEDSAQAFFRREARESREYPLDLKMRGVVWDTAAKGSPGDTATAEIPAGTYRLVLQYISPNSITSEEPRPVVCIVLSPTFERTQEATLFRFE